MTEPSPDPVPTPRPPGPGPHDDVPAEGATEGRDRATGLAVATADVVVAFGAVVGFNQLATQSPVDAILPVALISVGLGGLATAVASVVGAEQADRPPGRALAPPPLERGFAAFGIGLLAIAAVAWGWGTAAAAGLTAAAGVQLLLATELGIVLTLRGDRRRPHAVRLAALAAQTVLLLGFAWFALADAGVRPFA